MGVERDYLAGVGSDKHDGQALRFVQLPSSIYVHSHHLVRELTRFLCSTTRHTIRLVVTRIQPFLIDMHCLGSILVERKAIRSSFVKRSTKMGCMSAPQSDSTFSMSFPRPGFCAVLIETSISCNLITQRDSLLVYGIRVSWSLIAIFELFPPAPTRSMMGLMAVILELSVSHTGRETGKPPIRLHLRFASHR